MTTRIEALKKFHDGDALDDSELADMLHLYSDAAEALDVLEQVEPGYKFALQNAQKSLELLRTLSNRRRRVQSLWQTEGDDVIDDSGHYLGPTSRPNDPNKN